MIKGRQLDSKEQQLWNAYTCRIKTHTLKKNHKVVLNPSKKVTLEYTKSGVRNDLQLKSSKNVLLDVRLKHNTNEGTTDEIGSIGMRRSGLDNRTWRKLNRGQLRPEKTLDLHGYTAHSALTRLELFLLQSYRDRVRCVEVITGKGSVSGEGGVLRRELPAWLNRSTIKSLILATVHPGRFNVGAVRILLRRKRN